MEWQGWFTASVLFFALVVLVSEKAPSDLVMFCALTVIWLAEIIDTKAYLKGFSSSGLVTVGALFVVIKGVDKSGLVERVFRFLNNTPLVAIATPIVRDWARDRGVAPSQFLIPVDFATIMGGLLTLIGTSTNLQVNDFLVLKKQETFHFVEPGIVGLPVGLVCMAAMLLLSGPCLPRNKGGLFRELRQHGDGLVTALEVTDASMLRGMTVLDVLSHFRVSTGNLLKLRRSLGVTEAEPTSPGGRLDAVVASSVGKSDEPDVLDECRRTRRRSVVSNGSSSAGDKMDRFGFNVAADRFAPLEQDLHPQLLSRRPVASSVGSAAGHKPKHSGDFEVFDDCLSPFQRDAHPELLSRVGVTEIFPVPLDDTVRTGDVLLLSMSREETVALVGRNLAPNPGMRISSIHASEVLGPDSEFVEVVLGLHSPVVGQPISEGPRLFQSSYRAGLVAIRRRASILGRPDAAQLDTESAAEAKGLEVSTQVHHLEGSHGVFSSGDTVMLVAQVGAAFPDSDFLMVTRVGQVPRATRPYDYIPLVLFVIGLAVAASEYKDMLDVSIVLMLIFIAGGWVNSSNYASIIDWRLLVLIGSSTGFSEAMSASGLSKELAGFMMSDSIPRSMVLPLLFTLEVLLTEIVTNNAAVAIGLPLALDLAAEMNLKSHKPLTLAVMLGASVGFAMPMGYQTHLMVMGPGGYSVRDFLKFGVVIDLFWIVGVSLILPVLYPLE